LVLDPSFLNAVNTSVQPVADNTYDLGSSSYRWRNLLLAGYANIGSLQIGGTEVIDSLRNLKNVSIDASLITSGTIALARLPTLAKVALYAYDEKETTTTATSYPTSDQKYFLFANVFGWNKLRVVVEGKISASGYTAYAGVYVAGSQVAELSWTETSYTVKYVDVTAPTSSTTTTQVGLRFKVSGGTGYFRTVEIWGMYA